MHRLEPVIFHDAWGSHVSIASLTGRPIPSARPESELWMGAHEAGPSGVDAADGSTLADLIARDPAGVLGSELVDRFGPRLPFLLKVLAPGKAISIQAHPTADQALRERAESGDEVYGDDWAKPELLLAIAPFEVFVGLRDFDEARAFLDCLQVPALSDLAREASAAASPVHALLAGVLDTPTDEVTALTRAVVAACVRVEAVDDEFGGAAAAIVRIAEEHPDDIGLAVLVLMHHRVLQPGEFIDVAAGVLHSYVRGLGIEVLANSDNVVRAGLTSKEVNVPELLRIVDPEAGGVAGRPRRDGEGIEVFDSASDRFVLHRLRPAGQVLDLPGDGARLVFCLRGTVDLASSTGETLTLHDVESAFVTQGESGLTLGGVGEVYVVSAPTAYAIDA